MQKAAKFIGKKPGSKNDASVAYQKESAERISCGDRAMACFCGKVGYGLAVAAWLRINIRCARQ